MRQPTPYRKESITVAYLVERLRERVGIALEALDEADTEERLVTEPNIHRPGLALAGYTELFTHHRVQVLGNTECRYLAWLGEEKQREAFARLIAFDLPCIVLTAGNTLPEALRQMAAEADVPLFRTETPTVPFISQLRDFLEDQFAEQLTLHGSLVDVYGIGMLLTGPAGIGKSEVALDLVERGHRLVADDVVIASHKGADVLMGSGTDLAKHFMEIRGLGIVDVRAMFGVRAIRYQKRIEIIVRIHPWDEAEEYTRIGMVDETDSILGVELPVVKLPIVPGKNITVICEVIAMNHLLRHYGYDPAEVFQRRLQEQIEKRRGGAKPRRGIEWFEHDTE
ncbi:MAG: HPr(Ser) kinase/phosphatase [Bacteroidota bacterium]